MVNRWSIGGGGLFRLGLATRGFGAVLMEHCGHWVGHSVCDSDGHEGTHTYDYDLHDQVSL